MSSIGGQVTFPGGNLYHATKWGLEGLSQALAAELAPLGIRVTIVEPGPFATRFVEAMLVAEPVAEYAPVIHATLSFFRSNTPGDPALAMRSLLAAIDDPDAPLRVRLGAGIAETIENDLRQRIDELQQARQRAERAASR